MNAPSVARAASSASSSRRRRRIRSRISAAAFSVNVIVRIAATVDPILEHRAHESFDQHRRLAAAGAGVEQQVAVAALDRHQLLLGERRRVRLHWQGLKHGRSRGSGTRRASTSRAGLELAAAQPDGERHRALARVLEQLVELLSVASIVGDDRAADLRALEEHPPRAQIATAERLVEAGDRIEAEQLAHDEHVQRHLELAVERPARALVLGAGATALVVAHDPRVRRASTSTRSIDPAHGARLRRARAAGATSGSSSPSKPNRSSRPRGGQSSPSRASCARYRRRSALELRAPRPPARPAPPPRAIACGCWARTSSRMSSARGSDSRRDRPAEPAQHAARSRCACSRRGRAGPGRARAPPAGARARSASAPGSRRRTRARPADRIWRWRTCSSASSDSDADRRGHLAGERREGRRVRARQLPLGRGLRSRPHDVGEHPAPAPASGQSSASSSETSARNGEGSARFPSSSELRYARTTCSVARETLV